MSLSSISQRCLAGLVAGSLVASSAFGVTPVRPNVVGTSQKKIDLGGLNPLIPDPNNTTTGSEIGEIPTDLGNSDPGGIKIPGLPTTPTVTTNPSLGLGLGTTSGGLGSLGGLGGSSGYYPPNSPYAPWNPYDNYYGRWKPGMVAIQESQVPGVTCPLVDNRPQIDLVKAVSNLSQYVLPDDNCATQRYNAVTGGYSRYNNGQGGGLGGLGSGGLGSSESVYQRLHEAAAELQKTYNDQKNGIIDPATLNPETLQASIAVIMNGADQVVKSVVNNPAFGSEQCRKAGSTKTQILKAFGDLVGSLAPYALLAATVYSGGLAAPAAAAAGGAGAISAAGATTGAATAVTGVVAKTGAKKIIGYILGTAAFSSVLNIYQDMITADAIDMNKPDQREALMQNLCEYFRIKQRVDFLKLGEMGQIRNINERLKVANDRLNRYKKDTQLSLQEAFPKSVAQLSQIEDQVSAKLQNSQKTVLADKRELAEIKKGLDDQDPGSACIVGLRLAKNASDSTKFPGRSLLNYQNILKNQTGSLEMQDSFLVIEKNYRKDLTDSKISSNQGTKQCASGAACVPYASCAAIANGYIKTISKIVDDSEKRISNLKSSLTVQLNKDPNFKEFKTAQAAIATEVKIRETTGKLISLLADDNGSTVKSELDRQMTIIADAFFSSQWRRRAPVLEWLVNTTEQYQSVLATYQKENDTLDHYAKLATKSFQGVLSVKTKDGKIRSMTGPEINKQIFEDMEAVNKLSVISTELAPPGSDKNKAICQRLTNLNLQWNTIIGHLKAQKFFCDNIKSMIDARVDRKISEHCFGDVNPINGAVYKKSEMEQSLDYLAKKYANKARLADEKYRELTCDQKDATEVMKN